MTAPKSFSVETKTMRAFRLTLILTTALVSLSTSLSLRAAAQSVTAPEAEALRRSADVLRRSSDDPAVISEAYEQALQAFDALDDRQNALSVLGELFAVNYRYCEDDQAVFWAEAAIARSKADHQEYSTYAFWIRQLGDLYQLIDQNGQASVLYSSGIDHLERLQQSTAARVVLWREEAMLLRSQLSLPLSTDETTRIEARLVETREEIGAITQIEGLLQDASALQDTAYASSELATRALQNSQAYRYRSGELAALILLGEQAIAASDYRLALSHGEQVLALAKQLPDTDSFQTEALSIWADSQRGLGNADAAISAYAELLGRVEGSATGRSNSAEVREIVTTLIALYQETGQLAPADQLETDYAELLANPFGFIPTPLPAVSSLPRSRRAFISSFRRCDSSSFPDSFPSLQPLPTFPVSPPIPRPVRPPSSR